MTKDLQRFLEEIEGNIKNFCVSTKGKMIDRLPEFICELKNKIKKAKKS